VKTWRVASHSWYACIRQKGNPKYNKNNSTFPGFHNSIKTITYVHNFKTFCYYTKIWLCHICFNLASQRTCFLLQIFTTRIDVSSQTIHIHGKLSLFHHKLWWWGTVVAKLFFGWKFYLCTNWKCENCGSKIKWTSIAPEPKLCFPLITTNAYKYVEKCRQ